jgi:hypothetical protein
MAVNIPIISEFDGTGISKAIKQFKQLETNGEKAQFAIKKAAVPAGLALAGLAVALGDAAKGAIEDDAAQQKLALTLRNTTGATDAQIKANEDWISTQGKLLGISDDELRPTLARLVTQTHDVTKAQELAALAMDVSAGTGKNLGTVTEALAKAAAGSTTALGKLSPELKQMEKDGASADEMMAALSGTFMDQASTAAGTAEGQFKRLGVALAETKESVGAALLPAIEAVLPFLQAMGQWASENTTVFLIIAGVIGGIAAAIVITNAAMTAWAAATTAFTAVQTVFNAVMAANPVVLFAIAIAALVVGLVLAYKKFDAFRDIVDAVFSAIKTGIKGGMDAITTYLTFVMGVYKAIFNGIAKLWNNTIGKLSFSVPDWVPGLGGKGFDVPNIPMLANGGIVTSPTLAMIGEGNGPEAVIPLNRMNEFGMGGGMNVTVQAGLISTPDQMGQLIIEAIQRAQRRSGTVFQAA